MRPRIDAVAGATGQRLHYCGQRPRKRGSAGSLRARLGTAGEKAHAVAFSGDGKRPRDRPNKVLSLLSVHLTIKELMRFRRQETTCSDTSAFMTYNPHKSTLPLSHPWPQSCLTCLTDNALMAASYSSRAEAWSTTDAAPESEAARACAVTKSSVCTCARPSTRGTHRALDGKAIGGVAEPPRPPMACACAIRPCP